jgi:hypothetical protein
VRFAVVPWAPEYGSPAGDTVVEPALGDTPVDVAVEVPAEDWAPRPAPSDVELPRSLLFIDGVLRVDGGVWVEGADGVERPGLCGSYAAGAVRCDGQATLAAVEVRHALFTAAAGAAPIQTRHGRFDVCAVAGDDGDQLMLGLQQRMRELEVGVALHAGGEAELIVVDGPLTDRQSVAGAIGYVKTHHARYLPESVGDIVGRLGPGERTPVFLATTKWSRYSWYLRLPGDRGYAWEGVVRCEASADLSGAEAVTLADRVKATLPAYASAPQKDPRAPQNLYPIAGLERELRHRLGDPALLYRALRVAASSSS